MDSRLVLKSAPVALVAAFALLSALPTSTRGQLLPVGLPSGLQVLSGESDPGGFYEGPGVRAREILKARGYLARDFHIRSQDGYVLRVTRGRSPLVNGGRGGLPGRAPILFIHGILESFNVFVINSFDAKPSDLSHLNLTEISLEELEARLGDLPSAKALPLLAMDCGHEVWILSRRGFPGSQQMKGNPLEGDNDPTTPDTRGPLSAFLQTFLRPNLTDLAQQVAFSFDRQFWNFSLDEQARYDMPAAVDMVRNETGVDKIAVVAHSAGGTITLQALSLHPELNDKLSAVILWAQGFSLGHKDLFVLTPPALPLLMAYTGSLPPAFSTDQIQAFLGLFCTTQVAQSTLCQAAVDLILGPSGGQQPIRPEFINSLLYPSSSGELAQNVQCVVLGGQMHFYTKDLTRAVPYDLSTITNRKLSFYTGAGDRLVSQEDVRATLPLLRVPFQFHLINTTFDHNGYFYHKNAPRLAIIPSLREISLLSATA